MGFLKSWIFWGGVIAGVALLALARRYGPGKVGETAATIVGA